MVTARTLSPGERKLTIADSSPPVPAAVTMRTSFSVLIEGLQAGDDAVLEGGELRTAMVDHLAGAGLSDGVRERRGAGNAQVGLEAVHGFHLMREAG